MPVGHADIPKNALPSDWHQISKSGNKLPWPRGQFSVHQDLNCPNITATMWADTKMVKFLSTISTPGIGVNISRRINGRPTVIRQPSAAHQYGQHYKGVDLLDMKIASYGVGRNSKKVWRTLMYWMVNAALVNAWVIYNETAALRPEGPKKRFSPFDFRLQIAKQLINNFSCRKRAATKPAILELGPPDSHQMIRIGKPGQTRACRQHARFQPNRKTSKRTRYACSQCKQSLCPDCFYLYHNTKWQ